MLRRRIKTTTTIRPRFDFGLEKSPSPHPFPGYIVTSWSSL